jgi:hypothetical protein
MPGERAVVKGESGRYAREGVALFHLRRVSRAAVVREYPCSWLRASGKPRAAVRRRSRAEAFFLGERRRRRRLTARFARAATNKMGVGPSKYELQGPTGSQS